MKDDATNSPVASGSITALRIPIRSNSARVMAAQRPFAIALVPGTISQDTAVTIDARSSFASNNRAIAGYSWTALNVSGASPVIPDAAQSLTTLQVSGASQFTLRLTVTDDQGAQDIADVAVSTSTPPSAVPPPSNSGGGGGGSFSVAGLLALLALLALRLVRNRCALHA